VQSTSRALRKLLHGVVDCWVSSPTLEAMSETTSRRGPRLSLDTLPAFKASSAASHSGTAVRALGTPVSPLLMLMTFSHPIRGGIAAKGLGCQFCTARGWRRKAIWCRGVRDVSLRFAFVFFGAVESSRSETRDLSQTVC